MDLTNRERFLRLMRGEPVDRAPFFPCFGPWPETLERWLGEGLGEDEDWQRAAGFDGDLRHMVPINAFICPEFERRVIEDHGDTQIVEDKFGITQREHKDGRAPAKRTPGQNVRHPGASRLTNGLSVRPPQASHRFGLHLTAASPTRSTATTTRSIRTACR